MKTVKSIIPLLLIFILIFSTVGTASADPNQTNNINRMLDPQTLFSGYITVEFSQTTAHVNDTVLITVTANNNGLVDWYPVKIYAPIPNGLKYVSHIVPDKTRQDYDSSTGIWNPNRMRSEERGLLKTIVITTKVKPEAAGKTITATARFNTLVLEGYGVHMENTEYIPDARSTKLTVLTNDNGKNETDGPGTNGSTGPGTNGTGNDLINNLGNSKLTNAISNLTQSKKDNPLANLQTGGGGNGKSYEVLNTTKQNQPDNPNTLYGILGMLIIISLILAGYFKGMRNN